MENFFVRVMLAQKSKAMIYYASDSGIVGEEELYDIENDVISIGDELAYSINENIERDFNDFVQMSGATELNLSSIEHKLQKMIDWEQRGIHTVKERAEDTEASLLVRTIGLSFPVALILFWVGVLGNSWSVALSIAIILLGFVAFRLTRCKLRCRKYIERSHRRINTYKYAILLIKTYCELEYPDLSSKSNHENLSAARPH